MACSAFYRTIGTKYGWDGLLDAARKGICPMSNCCSSCQDSCDVSDMADHFMDALDYFLSTEYAKNCSQRYVTDFDCFHPYQKRHLFVNKNVCGHLRNGTRPSRDTILSNCECVCECSICEDHDDSSSCDHGCECQDIYCKLRESSLKTTTTPTTTTTTVTTKLKSTTTKEKFSTTEYPTTAVQEESTSPAAVTASTTGQPLHTYPPEHTSSATVTVTKQALSASNTDGVSSAAIGGSVAGVIVLVVVAILLTIFIRRRSSRQKRTQNNIQNHNGAFFNSAYKQAEVNLHSTTSGFITDSVIVPNGHGHHQNHFGNTDDHEYANTNLPHREKEYANIQVNDRSTKSFVENSDYEFAKPEGIDDNYLELKLDSNENSYERLKSQQTDEGKSQSLSGKYADTDNYELAKPALINNDENYFELEPQSLEDCDVKSQQNCAENYFVLEKENQSNRAGNIDDVYNTLHENLKANDDDNKDEYHHLRDITRSGREGTNHVDDDADDDYDMLKNGTKNKDDFFNDDYDHCKPRQFPNGEDDYDRFT